PAVREAQRKLNAFHKAEVSTGKPGLPDSPLVPDCVFGPRTYNAVRAFQQRVFPGQPQEYDGVIGPKTWAKLDAISPRPLPDPTPPGPLPHPTSLLAFNNSPQHWFLDEAEIAAARGNVELRRRLSVFTSDNLVQPLIDGEAMMRAMHDDLSRAGRGDF